MAGVQHDEKSFLSSFTTLLFKPKHNDPHLREQERHTSPRSADASPRNAAQPSPRAGDTAQAHAQPSPRAGDTTHTHAQVEVHTHVELHTKVEVNASNNSTLHHEDSIHDAKRTNHAAQDGAGDATQQRSNAPVEEHTAAQDLLEHVEPLAPLDQQRSDDLEKAIEAAEAETAEKVEKAKNEKKGGKEEEEQERKNWLAKTRENIKYTFISKETEEAFGEISILFDKLFDDFPYNKVDLMFGLMMLDDYYKNAPVLSASRVEDMEFIETARYYMKFAYCCYGWKFVYGILNRKTNKFLKSMVGMDANIKALFDCTGVEPKDIIVSKFTSSVFDPGHYICLCHERKTIVVAFRGTFHVRDALTDLVASNTRFMQGSAHTGLLRTANGKFRILAPIILKCFQENPTYKVIVVGHSLGAGTASLFSLIFHEAHPEVPMHCYAYAPPGVLSPDVALCSSTTELIDSIVVGNDIVPRLSFATLSHLKKVIIQILGNGNNTFQRAFQWMAGGMGDGMKHHVNGVLKIPEAVKIEPSPIPISDISVFPPGRLILLVPHTLTEGEESGSSSSSSDSDSDSDTEGVEVGGGGKSGSSLSPSPSVSCTPSPPASPRGHPPSTSTLAPPAPVSPRGHHPPPSTLAPPPPHPSSNPLRRLSMSFSPAKFQEIFSTSKKPKPPKAKKSPKPKTVYLMEYSNSALFNEIIISPSMFTSHMPSAYDAALACCVSTMRHINNSQIGTRVRVKLD